MKVLRSAPSNIALIKYMGKTESQGNYPTNPSLSYTLEHLRTFVQISQVDATVDRWQLLGGPEYNSMNLSSSGQERFLKHFDKMKQMWGVTGGFLIESANNFPADCGLASSASSFAALTMAGAEILQKIKPQPGGEDPSKLSEISRMGSGSSCRSFFSPWALWQHEFAETANFEYQKLHHLVVIVEDRKKNISSSQAHKLVITSPRFIGRVERANLRLRDLMNCLRFKDWPMAVQICWDEFMDMHKLFETTEPSFSYMNDDSKYVLNECKNLLDKWGDGPIVTMDAGANVHLLFREDQQKTFAALAAHFSEKYQVLKSPLVNQLAEYQ